MRKLLLKPNKTCECMWKEIIDFATWFDGELWLFRGMGDCEWEFLSSIDRFMYAHGLTAEPYSYFAEDILRKFKSRAHHYIRDLPEENDSDEWYAYIQHYGGPTHFIDVTASLFVALFFASDSSFSETPKSEGFCVYAMKKSELAKYYTVPRKINRRMQIQKGGFLRDKAAKKCVRSILEEKFRLKNGNWDEMYLEDASKEILQFNSNKYEFIKIVFPHECNLKILRMLHKMNLSYETLFPDLHGVIKELSWFPYKLHCNSPVGSAGGMPTPSSG